jgi:hypothetical protein
MMKDKIKKNPTKKQAEGHNRIDNITGWLPDYDS